MEETTFKDAKVKDKLRGFVKIKYRADKMSEPTIKADLDYFGVSGLPTYVVLVPIRRTTGNPGK
jgi:thiol:disulfide interchange protein